MRGLRPGIGDTANEPRMGASLPGMGPTGKPFAPAPNVSRPMSAAQRALLRPTSGASPGPAMLFAPRVEPYQAPHAHDRYLTRLPVGR